MIAKCCQIILDIKWGGFFWSSGCHQIFFLIYLSIFRNYVTVNECVPCTAGWQTTEWQGYNGIFQFLLNKVCFLFITLIIPIYQQVGVWKCPGREKRCKSMLAWSHYLLLTSPGHRDTCVWVIGVSGSLGRSVPFSYQFLPWRTWTFTQRSQSEGLLLGHLRGRAPHKWVRLYPNWHGITGQEITTRGVLCLKKSKRISLEMNSNS